MSHINIHDAKTQNTPSLRFGSSPRGPMARVAVVIAALALPTLAACADDSTAQAPEPSATTITAPDDDALIGASFASTKVEGVAIPGDGPLELTFPEAGRVSMTAGCNRHVGEVTVDGDTMTFGPLASTRLACPPPRENADIWVVELTDEPITWHREGADLVLDAGDRTVTLRPTT